MAGDEDKVNGENRKNTADNKNEQKEGKENKEKKKLKLAKKFEKFFTKCKHQLKDIKMKKLHKKMKLCDNLTPPLLPDINTSDSIFFEEYDEEETLSEGMKEWLTIAQKVYRGGSIENEGRDEVEALYTVLKETAFRVIKGSISSADGNRLKEAVEALEAIEEREHKDPRQPQRQWKARWKECVASSVIEQINRLPTFSKKVPGSSLGQVLATLGKTMKDDLTHVIENLKPHYPEDFDVCNTYALQYRQLLQSELSPITEHELSISEIHCLLSFTQSIYPNSILRDPVLIKHINVAQLEKLLPSEKVCHLEKMYTTRYQKELEKWTTNALKMEEDQWKEGRQPEMLGSVFHSSLSGDILQIYDSGINAAKEISENFANKMTPILANKFLEFLHRYKSSINNHCNKNKAKPHFMDVVIVNLNCCGHFRGFIERVSAGEDTKQKIYSVLSEIEDQGFGVLLQDLFQDIEFPYRRIRRTKGLKSQVIASQFITAARKYVSSVTTLSAPCRQVMAGKVHMHLVIEYLTHMKNITQCNTDEQEALATQMHRTADLFSHFCMDYLSDAQMSKATWANDAIRKMAEIVRLQNLDMIEHDVCVLARKYPDIRKCHVMSFLCIKNNLRMSERKSVLEIMDIIEHEDPLNRQLFTFIPCEKCFCHVDQCVRRTSRLDCPGAADVLQLFLQMFLSACCRSIILREVVS